MNLMDIRAEIAAANSVDRRAGRPYGDISNVLNGRVADIESAEVDGHHVVSLGSGPDIFSALYLYPMAKYFHLVDGLHGWADGSDALIEELEARLITLASGGQLDIESRDERPLCRSYQVPWRTSALGLRDLTVILHQLDFARPKDLDLLFQRMKTMDANPLLGGIVVTGVSADLNVRLEFLSRLSPVGSMYTEMIYVNEAGQSSSPEDQQILDAIGRDYDVADLGIASMKAPFRPHRFLITVRGP